MTFLRVGGMASLEEAIRVLGDVSEPKGRRCLAAKAVYLLGSLDDREWTMPWLRDPSLGRAILWAHKWRFARPRPGPTEDEALAQLADEAQSDENRCAAARRLLDLRAQKAVPTLLQIALDKGSSEPLYENCLDSVAHLGSRRATRALMRIVGNEGLADRRSAALQALGWLTDTRSIDVCLRIAADSTHETEEYRALAVQALGVGIGRRRVDEALVRYLDDSQESIRSAAVDAFQFSAYRLIGPALRSALIKAAESNLPAHDLITRCGWRSA